MSMIKISAIPDSKPIISRMVFVCPFCDQVDILDEDDYTPNMEKKCSKCNKPMTLQRAETESSEPKAKIKFKSKEVDGYDDKGNTSGDWFDNDKKE